MINYRYPTGPRETIHYNGYDTDEDCHRTSCDCDEECDCDIEDIRLTNIKSRHDIKKYLEEPNINIKKRDKYGNTILHLAIIYDLSLKLIETILEYGIDIDSINKNYSTPLYLASMDGNIDLIDILLNRCAYTLLAFLASLPFLLLPRVVAATLFPHLRILHFQVWTRLQRT